MIIETVLSIAVVFVVCVLLTVAFTFQSSETKDPLDFGFKMSAQRMDSSESIH